MEWFGIKNSDFWGVVKLRSNYFLIIWCQDGSTICRAYYDAKESYIIERIISKKLDRYIQIEKDKLLQSDEIDNIICMEFLKNE